MTKRFITGATVAGIGIAFLNLLPYLFTCGDWTHCGVEIAGFPFVFYRFGGITGVVRIDWFKFFADLTLGYILSRSVGIAHAREWKSPFRLE